MSKPRVLYIISDISKALEFEWAWTYLHDDFDMQFILLNDHDTPMEFFLINEGAPVTRLPLSGSMRPGNVWRLMQNIRKAKPDILHAQLWRATLLAIPLAWLLGIKKRIYTRHHSSFNHLYHKGAVKWDRLVNRLSTDIVAISGGVKEILIQWEKVPPRKVHLIPHGVELERFTNVDQAVVEGLRKKYTTEGKGPVIGVIARYTEWKGIQYIIPAFHKLLEKYPDAVLLLANARKGEYMPSIDDLLRTLPKDAYVEIEFEPEIQALYQLFDVFVHVPIDPYVEAFGQIYIEALATGTPMVATKSGVGNDLLVDGENCLEVPYQDADAIHQAVIRILEDESLRKKLSRNGPASVRSYYTAERKFRQLKELYRMDGKR